MRKISCILFTALYMLCFSEMHQFLKIPVLIQHYTEHKQQNPSIGFLDFLAIHYDGLFEKDADYQRDQQLPFRDMDCMAFNFTICECPAVDLVISPQNFIEKRKFILRNEVNASVISTSDIFQPPRCA